jgi:hypothetical protein
MKWFILFALVAFAFAQEEATGDLGEEPTGDLGKETNWRSGRRFRWR